mmetsp:Transcript_43659/g.113796  ORF Transcript_43659/g.113796 Transcript_43659/m.113796 type:complete len:211 (-) Transcript_43659:436-1068(-)
MPLHLSLRSAPLRPPPSPSVQASNFAGFVLAAVVWLQARQRVMTSPAFSSLLFSSFSPPFASFPPSKSQYRQGGASPFAPSRHLFAVFSPHLPSPLHLRLLPPRLHPACAGGESPRLHCLEAVYRGGKGQSREHFEGGYRPPILSRTPPPLRHHPMCSACRFSYPRFWWTGECADRGGALPRRPCVLPLSLPTETAHLCLCCPSKSAAAA